MATLEEEQKIKGELQQALNKLNSIKPESLVQADRLGQEMSFESGLPYFDRVLRLFHMLHDIDMETIPHGHASKVLEEARTVDEQIQAVLTFRPIDNNPIATRDGLINWFMNRYDHIFNAISPIISFAIRKGTDFEKLQVEARDALAQLAAAKAQAEADGKKMLDETQSVLTKVRQAAADVGVAQHATHFQKEADFFKDTSVIWLKFTIGLGTFAALWGYFSFALFKIPADATNTSIFIVQSVASRISVLFIALYLLLWCARNYAARQHNFVINKHRQNALSTFETFIKAAGDDLDTKNAVLLQTTQCIFANQPSGFINKDSDQDSPNKIIEIMRSAGSLTKGT